MQTVTCIFIRSLLCSHWKHCKQTALDVPTERSDFPISLISLLPAAFRLGFDRRELRASRTAWLQPEHLFNVHISQCLNHNHCWGGWEHVCYHHGSAVGTDHTARTSLDRILGCSTDSPPPPHEICFFPQPLDLLSRHISDSLQWTTEIKFFYSIVYVASVDVWEILYRLASFTLYSRSVSYLVPC